MKKTISKWMIFSSVIFTFSCTQNSENDASNVQKEIIVEENKLDSDSNSEELHLNGDQKWNVSPHMIAHLDSIENLILSNENLDNMTGQSLANAIDSQLKLVTQSCDMQGEAHEQLHLWLLPFWDLVDQLATSEGQENQVKLVNELITSMNSYHTYFE